MKKDKKGNRRVTPLVVPSTCLTHSFHTFAPKNLLRAFIKTNGCRDKNNRWYRKATDVPDSPLEPSFKRPKALPPQPPPREKTPPPRELTEEEKKEKHVQQRARKQEMDRAQRERLREANRDRDESEIMADLIPLPVGEVVHLSLNTGT